MAMAGPMGWTGNGWPQQQRTAAAAAPTGRPANHQWRGQYAMLLCRVTLGHIEARGHGHFEAAAQCWASRALARQPAADIPKPVALSLPTPARGGWESAAALASARRPWSWALRASPSACPPRALLPHPRSAGLACASAIGGSTASPPAGPQQSPAGPTTSTRCSTTTSATRNSERCSAHPRRGAPRQPRAWALAAPRVCFHPAPSFPRNPTNARPRPPKPLSQQHRPL
jgi:hypothetical protein